MSAPTSDLGWRRHRILGFLLGDPFLGFLAIGATAITLIPLLFEVSAQTNSSLETVQWLIISLFAVEYGLSLRAASSKRSFLLNPWRLIDAATILVPLATLLPGVSDLLRSSALLRLTRLARVVALGARAGGVMVREEQAAAAPQVAAPVQVRVLSAEGAPTSRAASWDEFVRWARQPGAEWYSLANVGERNLAELSAATGISREFISTHLLSINYPHLEVTDRFVSLFLWLPERSAAGTIERNGLLLLASDKSIVTFSRRPTRSLDSICPSTDLSSFPFPTRILCQCLKRVLDANETLVGGFEVQLRALEDLPVRESRPQFFEHTFRLKKELSAAQSDLWRLRGVLKELTDARVKLPGLASADLPLLRELAETADYLYETVNQIREGVLSLIELHLNVVSFEMNRVMRVLAVVSVLGLIPGVVGGLFGMNLAGNPWPFTLPQVTFAVVTAMATCFYFFMVKGWLR